MPNHLPLSIPAHMLRAYDIRGETTELTEDVVYALGLSLGTEIQLQQSHQMVVGRDGRLSSPLLSKALIQGLIDTGCEVIDIGLVPTPVLYFALHFLNIRNGVMLTGSHNPANYNGLKITVNLTPLMEGKIVDLATRVTQQAFIHGKGHCIVKNIIPDYIHRIQSTIKLERPLSMVIDCGNGATSVVAQALYETLGCKVHPLFCEIDGHFPNHHPDPTIVKNLNDVIRCVRQTHADIGLAFDGDGDRLGVVTNQGEIIWPDRQMMLYAQDVLSRNPGATIIYDIKSTRFLADIIEKHGGQPLMWKTGHSFIKNKLKETGALLAGEMSGHIFFKERWYGFDDGLYTGARLLEILSHTPKSAHEIFLNLPNAVNTPEIKVAMPDNQKFDFIETLKQKSQFENAKINTIDGLRVDFPFGWGLIRASNTTPCLTLRFEADDETKLNQIKSLFKDKLMALDPNLVIPF